MPPRRSLLRRQGLVALQLIGSKAPSAVHLAACSRSGSQLPGLSVRASAALISASTVWSCCAVVGCIMRQWATIARVMREMPTRRSYAAAPFGRTFGRAADKGGHDAGASAAPGRSMDRSGHSAGAALPYMPAPWRVLSTKTPGAADPRTAHLAAHQKTAAPRTQAQDGGKKLQQSAWNSSLTPRPSSCRR